MLRSRRARRSSVFLHVGSPKTGTTFLQNVLWKQRGLALEQGLLLPQERFHDHYLASLDVRGVAGREHHPKRAVGMWDRVVEEVGATKRDVLVSHELFAAASAEQARRAVESLADAGEVHVVLTVRDLVRQITAEWQEHVKHRSAVTLEEFVASLRADTARTSWFWQVQDFASVVERWRADLPADRVHVVTVPPAGSPPGLLWDRFAGLLGLDPGAFDTESSRSNTSLGAEQAELLRRVNAGLGTRLPLPGPYPAVAKELLAHRLLAARSGGPLRLTPEDMAFAVDESAAQAARLDAAGVHVVGDLADIVPDAAAAGAAASPDAYAAPDEDRLLEEGVAAIQGLLVALADRRGQRRYEQMSAQLRDAPVRFLARSYVHRHPLLARGVRAVRRR